jgi:hypothetical protein
MDAGAATTGDAGVVEDPDAARNLPGNPDAAGDTSEDPDAAPEPDVAVAPPPDAAPPPPDAMVVDPGEDPTCPADDALEDNDDPDGARPAGPMTDLVGIVCGEDEDWFRLDADAGCRMTLDLSFDGRTGDIDIRLWDEAGELIDVSEGLGDEERIELIAVSDGPWFAQILLLSGEGTPYRFSLAVECFGGPAGEGLVINEIDYDQPQSDRAEFVEILNTSDQPQPLDGVVLEFLNGSDGQIYREVDLSDAGDAVPPGGRLVAGAPAVLDGLPGGVLRAVLPAQDGIQNGREDGVRIRRGGAPLDRVSYEGVAALDFAEGPDGAPGDSNDVPDRSIGRCPDGEDTDDNGADFVEMASTPGLPNDCR